MALGDLLKTFSFAPPSRISILTLWQYAMSKKVVLPSYLKGKDRSIPSAATNAAAAARGREKPPSDVGKQLEAVKAHIEDLHVRQVASLAWLRLQHGYLQI